MPSATVAGLNGQAAGVAVEQMSVQVPAPAGDRWTLTDARPDPPSLAVFASDTGACSGLPGSFSVVAGTVLSVTRVMVGEVVL